MKDDTMPELDDVVHSFDATRDAFTNMYRVPNGDEDPRSWWEEQASIVERIGAAADVLRSKCRLTAARIRRGLK